MARRGRSNIFNHRCLLLPAYHQAHVLWQGRKHESHWNQHRYESSVVRQWSGHFVSGFGSG